VSNHKLENTKVAIIGLGYVGLPLAVECGENTLPWCISFIEA